MEMKTRFEQPLNRLTWIALLVLACIVFQGKAYETSLQAMDSAVHARLALDASAASGSFFPKLPLGRAQDGGHWSERGFNDHPWTLFWVVGHFMRKAGVEAWSARFLPSCFAVGSVLLTALLGSLFFSPAVGWVAAVILATTPEFIGYSARFHLDAALVFFTLLALLGWRRGSWLGMGMAAGLSVWFKNPLAFLVFPALFLVSIRRKHELTLIFKAAFLASFIGALFWALTGFLGGWELVRDYWVRQVFGTAVGGRGGQSVSFFLFAEILIKRYWPWLPFLVGALGFLSFRKKWRDPSVAAVAACALVAIVGVSSMRFKFPHYYLPMYPFLALLIACSWQKTLDRCRIPIQGGVIFLALIFGTALAASPLGLAPESFPHLKRFNALIQSYGTCHDTVLMVKGGQPYGSDADYSAEVIFYTARNFQGVPCDQVSASIEKLNPAWLIVAESKLQECVPPSQAALYPTHYRVGDQWLLSRVVPPGAALDLTALERELKAVPDCEVSALPKDRYHRYE